jgi:hypothetical protein
MTSAIYQASRIAEAPRGTEMNAPQKYVYGRYKVRILPDGSIGYYREVLSPDGLELIGTEYPNEDYCWFNVRRAAREAGLTHDAIFEAEQSARALIYNDAYIAGHLAEVGVGS